MKNLILKIVAPLLIVFFTSCLKENHSVRLQNNYAYQVNNFVAGTASIGNVAAGSTSEYKSISTGNFNISGTTTNNQSISGSGSITGKGTHKWTITLSSAGQVTIKEDK